jgi:hypothetical protein
MTMDPYTRKDLEFQRRAYADCKADTFVKETTEEIYHNAIKTAVERDTHAYYYTMYHAEDYMTIDDLAVRVRDKLVVLFPDFEIEVGHVNDGYNRSRYIRVKW